MKACVVLLALGAGMFPAFSRANAQASGSGAPAPAIDYPIDPSTAPRPIARATRTLVPIVLDGRLDEPEWQTAEPLTNFVQSQPDRGALAGDQTVVRILFDHRYLYVGAMMYQSDPDKIVVTTLERDFGGATPRDFDVLSITIDPFLDRRNSFLLHVNPVGAIRDAQTSDNGRTQNPIWRGVWRAEAMITDSGWVAEAAIPWTTLRFDPNREEQIWGLNFRRRVLHTNEESAWAPLERHEQSHRMSRAGTLIGLDSLRSGHQLMVKPFALVAHTNGDLFPETHETGRWDAGLDLKYGVTPRLTLDFTYNTDFSQADDDQEQVNLTRFGLFRPERRGFFLENAGIFGFGDVTERSFRMGVSPRDFTMFHSRRIGLTEDGRTIPIQAGGRLTGRMGPFELGLLTMQTESALGLPAENFLIARVRRELFSSSDVGMMLVNRQAFGEAGLFNRSYGADANFRPHPSMIINSYVARSEATGAGSDDVAWRLSAGWRDRLWDVSGLIRQIGDSFDPGAGFIRRRGLRHYYTTVGAHTRVPFARVQETNPYVELDFLLDRASVLETRSVTLGLATEFLDGGTLDLAAFDRFERLVEPFRVAQGASVPAGDFAFREATVSYASNRARDLSATGTLSAGGYYGGTRTSVEGGAVWQPNYRWSVNLAAQRNDVRLPDAAFVADVFSARLGYAHSRELFGRASVQYNGATEQMLTNIRVNLIHAPLSDLFLVFAERRDLGTSRVLERGLTAKVTRLVSF